LASSSDGRARRGAILLAAALVAQAAAPARAVDPLEALERAEQALYDRVAPAVVVVECGPRLGSGFFVRPDGLVLTSGHILGEQSKATVVLLDGRRLEGTVVERAADQVDLALLRVPVTGAPVLELDAGASVRVGSFAATVGHGEGDRGLWTLGVGLVTNLHPLGGGRPVLQTQIPINPGNSGGPVVDRQGRVIGVVTAAILPANNVNFAIRTEVALRALAGLAGGPGRLVVEAPVGAPIFVDGREAGAGPRASVAVAPGRHEVMVLVGARLERRTIEFPATAAVEVR
jgi:S1-C subfamily serine protease